MRTNFPHLSEDNFFSVDNCYEYANYTRRQYGWVKYRYYTTNLMMYVGRYVRSEGIVNPTAWNKSIGAAVFNDNGR